MAGGRAPIPLFAFYFPVQAKVKGRPRFSRGRVFTPQATQDYEAEIAKLSKQQWVLDEPLTSKIGVVVTFVMKPIRGDIDNLLKALYDGMQRVVFKNDSQIVWGAQLVLKASKASNPNIKVDIYDEHGWNQTKLFGVD